MQQARHQQGYTLLEMSIVLLVIGILVGSIVVGQSVLRTAKLQTVMREYDIKLKAFKEFMDKYNGLPGDLSTATAYWGLDTICPNTTPKSAVALSSYAPTCSGDGNGKIGVTAATWNYYENWRAWQHLSNAGLIDGRFTGVLATGGKDVAGLNVPGSEIEGAGWLVAYYSHGTTDSYMWGDLYGNVFAYGGTKNMYSTDPHIYGLRAIITPRELYEIDQKMDDGFPGTGTVRSWRRGLSGSDKCTDNDTAQASAVYNLDTRFTNCTILFVPGF